MKTKLIMITTLLALCMAFAFAGCGSSESDNSSESNNSGDTASAEQTSGSGCDFDFPHTGFGFDLPEGMEITKGYYYPYDMGDVNYNSGVMMSWPVYADVPEDTYKNLTDEEAEAWDALNLDSLGIDCVRVSPLITASDLSQIEYRIKGYGQVRRRRQETDFVRQMDEVGVIAGDLSSLIRKYRHYEIAPNVNFRELLRVLAMQVTDSLAAASKVILAVTERERLNSQIFPELGFCLLHSRTDAVSETVFVSCSARGHDHFTDPALKGIQAAVLMLMPVDDHRRIHSDVLGRISGAFIKNEVFLKAVQEGEEDNVRTELTHELRIFFNEYVEKL